MVWYNAFSSRGWLDECEAGAAGQLEVVAGDVRSLDSVRAIVQGCGVVFHLAALVGIPYSYVSPESYVDTNVKGTMHVLQEAQPPGPRGSCMFRPARCTGSPATCRWTRIIPCGPNPPTRPAKIAADQLALSFHRSFGAPVAIARPFNTFVRVSRRERSFPRSSPRSQAG